MAINRTLFRKQLEPGLNVVFGLDYKRYKEEWREFMDTETSVKAFEEDVLVSGFGAAPVKAEGAGVQYDTAKEVWTARYTHETVALAFSITHEAIKDNLYGNLGTKYARALARSLIHTKEVKAANILNRGFNSSYTGGDGKELFATDHPLDGGGTFQNELTTGADLSETALEDACIEIAGFVDERGIPVSVMPRKLIIPRQLQFEAQRILYSDLRSGTPDNDTNAMKDMGMFPEGFAVVRRLTDPDAWFIKTDCPDGLKHISREGVQTSTEVEFNSANFRYKAMERYINGWTDPRGAFGSPGA